MKAKKGEYSQYVRNTRIHVVMEQGPSRRFIDAYTVWEEDAALKHCLALNDAHDGKLYCVLTTVI